MKRTVVDGTANSPRSQQRDDFIPADGRVGMNADRKQMPGVKAALGCGDGAIDRKRLQAYPITFGDRLPRGLELVGSLQLSNSNGRREIGQIVFEAGRDDLVGPVAPTRRNLSNASRSRPWVLIARARAASSGFRVAIIPPSPVVIVLLAWKEKTHASDSEAPTRTPFRPAGKA